MAEVRLQLIRSCGLHRLWPPGLTRRSTAGAVVAEVEAADTAEAARAAVAQVLEVQVPEAPAAVVMVVPGAPEALAQVEAADTAVPAAPVAQVPALWEHHLCTTSRDRSFRSSLSRQPPTSRCSTSWPMEPAASSLSTPMTCSAAWRRSPRINPSTTFSDTNRLNR